MIIILYIIIDMVIKCVLKKGKQSKDGTINQPKKSILVWKVITN